MCIRQKGCRVFSINGESSQSVMEKPAAVATGAVHTVRIAEKEPSCLIVVQVRCIRYLISNFKQQSLPLVARVVAAVEKRRR